MRVTAIAAASFLSAVGAQANSINRRFFDLLPNLGHCLGECENGHRFGLSCLCNDGWEGGCCDISPKCANVGRQLSENVVDINQDEFFRASWYVQKQQEAPFQTKENFFCITATYDAIINDPISPALGISLTASNGGKQGGVGGEEDGVVLCGGPGDGPGKLKVAPCPVFKLAAGDFWVAAVGANDKQEYEWAIIIAGLPTKSTSTGCTAPNGLWLYTRDPVPSAKVLDAMDAALKKAELSDELLLPVVQEGCSYDRRTKPSPKPGPGASFIPGFRNGAADRVVN